ncbi:hypothetical protein [Nocardia sp. NPDC058114]|uniref:hypothetical protein n=1 Tax=Nocardia sp. NPDC058114 TaxID=3346346 RepID=UPI0036DCBF83
MRSSTSTVSVADLNEQITGVFDDHQHHIGTFQQFSFGNEGSVLDPTRFHSYSLHHLLDHAASMESLEVLSLETRPEYISRGRLIDVRARTTASVIDLTVGFETQDDEVRQVTLRKKISRRMFEDRIALLGELGMRLTSYVLIKPAPRMSEEQGVAEAIATMEYLGEICDRHGVDLVIYLTPTYIAQGSHLQRVSRPGDWVPPKIQSIYRIAVAGHRMGLPVYTGLWSEGLADEENDFRGHTDYDPSLRLAMVNFDRTADPSYLEPYSHLLEHTDEDGEAACARIGNS